MKELYINSKLVEIDSKTRLDLQFKSFLFSGISELTAPRSWTVSLPKSSNNLALIEGTSSGDSASEFPYNNYVVDYYSNGYKVINEGKGVLIKITDRIEFVFTFGKAYEVMKLMSEKKLTELTEVSTDFGHWNRSMISSAVNGFYWYNWYSFTNEDKTWVTANPDLPMATLHPVVFFSYIVTKIQLEFGITLTGLISDPFALPLSFPLRKFDGISTIGKNIQTSVSGTNLLDTYVIIPYTDGFVNYFNLQYQTGFKSIYDRTVSITITSFNVFTSFNANDDIILRIKEKSGAIREIVRIQAETAPGNTGYIYSLYNYTFQFNADDDYFYFQKEFFLTDILSTQLTFLTLVKQAYYEPKTSVSETADGGYFPIIPNLPDMTCADFIFQAMQLVGVFPSISDNAPTTINFISADVLYSNRGSAKDWTNKLVKTNPRLSELSDVAFKFGKYAKKNTLKYKADETNLLDTSSFLEVQNDNLELESKLVELLFAAGKRFSTSDNTIDYPLYDISIASGNVLIRNPKSPNNDVIANYIMQFPDELLWNGATGLKATYYTGYQSLLTKPRYLREKFYLKPEDIAGLTLDIPIYLQQYGKYYAIMVLQYKEDEFSECELLEIKNI